MKGITKTILLAIYCLVATLSAMAAYAGDCPPAGREIATNRNNPSILEGMLATYPECGEIYVALGDYFYGRQKWDDASSNYEEAQRLLPGNRKVAGRLMELRGKETTLIANESDLMDFRRGLGGRTAAPPEANPRTSSASPENMEIAMADTGSPHSRSSGGAASASKPDGAMTRAQAVENPTMQAGAPMGEKSQSEGGPAVTRKAASDRKSHSGAMAVAREDSSIPRPSTGKELARPRKIGLMVHFDYNSSNLTPEGMKLLEGFSDLLQKEFSGGKFIIVGHTDNVGGQEYNLWLSAERARAAKEFLTQHGVDSARLETRGAGMDEPIADNATEDGRMKNRRVEFEESGL
jgi:outer membrane protein OmpA-like peptidoglycan-associated protein